MAGSRLLLIDNLVSLALGEPPQVARDPSDYVRASLLTVSSHSPDACAAAERIGYGTYEDDTSGTPVQIRSVGVPAAAATLREIVEGLQALPAVPEPLASELPDLTHEDYRAALYAIRCILYALEGSDRHAQLEPRYAPEKARALVVKSLELLDHYRVTGEP
jgi:hypothetical protein